MTKAVGVGKERRSRAGEGAGAGVSAPVSRVISKGKGSSPPRASSGRAAPKTAVRLRAARVASTHAGGVPDALDKRGSGDDVLAIAGGHLGEQYRLGARAPMADSTWAGPWDCAEFASWCLYQATGRLYGTEPQDDPVRADAYSGFWADQAERDGATISAGEAAAIAGAFLLRKPGTNGIGHIVISDGEGGTVEAQSTATGVVRGKVAGRRWDYGILVPGVDYTRSERPLPVVAPVHTLRVTRPLMRGAVIERLQELLVEKDFAPGPIDGIYGPQTAHAVALFQAAHGLVVDGEAGAQTLGKLGLKLPV